jgi:hypothetical protein
MTTDDSYTKCQTIRLHTCKLRMLFAAIVMQYCVTILQIASDPRYGFFGSTCHLVSLELILIFELQVAITAQLT